jgi:hypothetical protein
MTDRNGARAQPQLPAREEAERPSDRVLHHWRSQGCATGSLPLTRNEIPGCFNRFVHRLR